MHTDPPSQFDIVAGQLRDDPENAELAALKDELNNFISLLNDSIAELKPQQQQQQAPQPAKQPSPPRAAAAAEEPRKQQPHTRPDDDEAAAPAVNYKVNDTVLAKWLSGDKGFYPARITSVTGSSTAPIYTVKFKSYDNTETLRSRDIRPVSNKRKAEGPPPPPGGDAVPPPPPPAAAGPGVVSAAGATVYQRDDAAAAKAATGAGSDAPKPPKAKKIKAKKELEAGKNKWQEFNAKSKFGKTHKKESMFRTPEGVHGRGMCPLPLFLIPSVGTFADSDV